MLAAGVDVERYKLYKELKQTLIQQQDDIIQWLQRHGGSAKSRKIRKMEALVDETKMKLLKLNMIPGTSTFSRVGALRDVSDDEHVGSIETNALDIAEISIDIHGTIFFGSELRIGNRTMTLAKTISNRRIKLKKNLKGLIATPLKGK
jgi:SPX domain protein involved in polyphosphate accumulation